MNKVFLNGYLAQDPKGGVTSKGIDFTNITVACSDVENFNETYFIKCCAYGNTAKYVNANLTKGSLVAIDGKIINRKYVNNNGVKVIVTKVVVNNLKAFTKKSHETIDVDIDNVRETIEETIEESRLN